jgi:hypothetical protein
MNEIDPDRYYNINSISRLRLLPWIHSYATIRRYVKFDMEHDNFLKAMVKPSLTSSGERFFIKGENIIKVIAKFEDGTLFLNHGDKERKKWTKP